MSASITALRAAERALDELLAELDPECEKAPRAILNYALKVQHMQQTCETRPGGSNFGKLMKERRGWSAARTSRWLKIGENHDRLLRYCKSLPPSWTAIAQIADLPEEAIEKWVKPDMICSDVADIHQRLGRQSRRAEWAAQTAERRREFQEADMRQFLAAGATERGIDPDGFPTNDALRHAVVNRRKFLEWRASVLQRLDEVTALADSIPDAALKDLLRLPLGVRLRWINEHRGFCDPNPSAVLGVPFGLATETYNAVYCAACFTLGLNQRALDILRPYPNRPNTSQPCEFVAPSP